MRDVITEGVEEDEEEYYVLESFCQNVEVVS